MSEWRKLAKEVYPNVDDIVEEIRRKQAEPVRKASSTSMDEALAEIAADNRRARYKQASKRRNYGVNDAT